MKKKYYKSIVSNKNRDSKGMSRADNEVSIKEYLEAKEKFETLKFFMPEDERKKFENLSKEIEKGLMLASLLEMGKCIEEKKERERKIMEIERIQHSIERIENIGMEELMKMPIEEQGQLYSEFLTNIEMLRVVAPDFFTEEIEDELNNLTSVWEKAKAEKEKKATAMRELEGFQN